MWHRPCCSLLQVVLVLCVAAAAMAAPAPQYRGNGPSQRVFPDRYQKSPSSGGGNQRQLTRQRTQSAPGTRAPTVDRGSQQYDQDFIRQRTQPAPVHSQRTQSAPGTRAPTVDRGSQQYDQDSTRQRTHPAPVHSQRTQSAPGTRAPTVDRGSQQYDQDSTRQRTQPAPAAGASHAAGRGNQQYSQRTQPAPAVQAPADKRGTQQYRGGDPSSARTPPVPIVRYQNSPTADGGNQHA